VAGAPTGSGGAADGKFGGRIGFHATSGDGVGGRRAGG
jgi:hypothetical protein